MIRWTVQRFTKRRWRTVYTTKFYGDAKDYVALHSGRLRIQKEIV